MQIRKLCGTKLCDLFRKVVDCLFTQCLLMSKSSLACTLTLQQHLAAKWHKGRQIKHCLSGLNSLYSESPSKKSAVLTKKKALSTGKKKPQEEPQGKDPLSQGARTWNRYHMYQTELQNQSKFPNCQATCRHTVSQVIIAKYKDFLFFTLLMQIQDPHTDKV